MMLSSLQLIGDVELTNMQLKPEALNSLKLPVRVKAGFLGSVKLKVCSNFFALVQMQNCFAVFVILWFFVIRMSGIKDVHVNDC